MKLFFIAPRISHRGSKHAPRASTQKDSTPPRAASSLWHHRGFGAVGGGLLGLEEGGRDMVGDLLWDFPPSFTPSFIYLFTSRHIT